MKIFEIVKRLLDLSISFFLLVILLPLLLIITILVFSSSKGPVIYSGSRIGKNGKQFKVYKFRSMFFDKQRKETITIGNDKRITKIGTILRMSKLDELPQLLNILKGEMSFIGPRPESKSIVEEFYSSDDKKNLLSIRPGLTSPGTLLFYIYHEKLETPKELSKEIFYGKYILPLKLLADKHYVYNRNISYDINLFFKTIIIIFKKLFSLKIIWRPLFYGETPINWKDPRF